MAEENKKVYLTIPFPSSDDAQLAYEVLNVDKELKGVERNISTDKANLIVNFESSDFKRLRVTVNGFLQNLILVAKTMGMFNGN
ncbi:unnamed protein product [Colias eurytheme]|nr:unnamed protein product [Colias eurytheme]